MNTVHLHMFCNAYARSVGKGEGKVPVHHTELERLMINETLASGYFHEALHQPYSETLLARYPELRTLAPAQARRWLWEQYCALSCAQRAEFVKQASGTNSVTILEVESLFRVFGHRISHDALTLPHVEASETCRSIHAPPLMITGWYDWGLNDALATWELFRRCAQEPVASRSRLIITPSAHNAPGYHEGSSHHPELQHNHRTVNHVGLLLHWYNAVRESMTDSWPQVIYYLLGANEWRVTSDWPPPEVRQCAFYLAPGGMLTTEAPQQHSTPDQYVYNPEDPTPTLGGSIARTLPARQCRCQQRPQRSDVLTYTTASFVSDLDVVGPLRLILYASSSALDTDFSARLSDVFPDGRALQLQSGMLRARYRDLSGEPELLEPGRSTAWTSTCGRRPIASRRDIVCVSTSLPQISRGLIATPTEAANPGRRCRQCKAFITIRKTLLISSCQCWTAIMAPDESATDFH